MKTTRPPSACRSRTAGFSTADVLAGLCLSLVAIGAIYAFGRAQSRALAAQSAYNESQGVTRLVMDLIARELRMTSFDPTDSAIPNSPGPSCTGVNRALIVATPTKIRFQQDLNGNGVIGASGSEDVTYDVLGDKIRRQDGTSLPEDLVSGVTADGFVLQYYNGSSPPLELVPSGSPPALTQAQRDCVAKVRVTVRAKITDTSHAGTYGLTSLAKSEVAIRNRSLANF